MKAKLVMTSFVTRVIVQDDATNEDIINKARHRLQNNLESEYNENVEVIMDDLEEPWEPITSPLTEFGKIYKMFDYDRIQRS